VEVKTKKHFNKLIKSLTLEVLKNKELDEMTATDDVEGYNTPFFLTGKSKGGKAKKRKIATNSTGYKMLEGIDSKDLKTIKKLIRNVVANILRDIWIKRHAWKNPK
tara:strand:+ start:421 stop:738 length:318 start_codon:yes stop_codon:yes gene_type:complete